MINESTSIVTNNCSMLENTNKMLQNIFISAYQDKMHSCSSSIFQTFSKIPNTWI